MNVAAVLRGPENWANVAAHAIAAVALSLLLMVPMGVSAQVGEKTFENTAMAKFNEADLALLKAAAIEVLNDPSPQASQAWANSDNGHHGVIRFVKAFEAEGGRHCKRLRFDNFADGLNGTVRFNVCRAAGEKWRLDS
jgi:surface antigen